MLNWLKSLFTQESKPKTAFGKGAFYVVHRVSYTDKGTFGVFLTPKGKPLCVTLEDPDNNNKQNISCIPTGLYRVKKHFGRKFTDVWILENVPNRTAILIHAGNTIEDTSGCILVGQYFDELKGVPAVLNSKVALNKLRTTLPDEFTLEII